MLERATNAYQELRRRVLAVAALHRRCALVAGAGNLIWRLGVPLLVLILAERLIGLPLLLRLLVLPAFGVFLLWWGWRLVGRPLLARYSLARAALLIEAKRPDLKSRVISALELYPELEAGRMSFDAGMLAATVLGVQLVPVLYVVVEQMVERMRGTAR